MKNILIVEDDFEISEILRFYLEKEGKYAVKLAKSAEESLFILKDFEFDLILMDVQLPGVDGINFTKELRKKINCPIIFISCLEDENTIINAMNSGGDDYLVKPFNCNILLAKIDANIRRFNMLQKPSTVLKVGDIVLDSFNREVKKNENILTLTITEYEILYYLMQHRGEFISFENLYTAIWYTENIVDIHPLFVHVSNLRRKIEDDTEKGRYIKTVQRKGYIFSSF